MRIRLMMIVVVISGLAQTARASERDASLRSCLQKHVTISKARIERGDFSRNLRLNVTNKLSWAIAFVHIGYKVTTPGRSVPWSEKNFGVDISGGIEPGETRSIGTSIFFDIPDIAKNLTVVAEMLDVADAEKRQLIGETKFMGNSKEPSPLQCKGTTQ